MIERALERLGARLASPRGGRLAPIAALTVTATSLAGGIVRGDDSLQLLKARGALAHGLGRLDLFCFVPGTAQGNAFWADVGMVPWLASRDLRLSFFRPIASLSAFADYTLLARVPVAIHLESVALYAGLVALVAAAYRRLLPAPIAALAALLYALDDAHLFPVAWLANRNALFAGAFGVAAWIAHDRWRRDGWRPGVAWGPLAFVGALLSAEAGAATLAYLVAHAVTLDPERSKAKRAALLLPYAVVLALWQLAYRALGYGARGSGYYIDPGASLGPFVLDAPQRLCALLLGQLAVPASDVSAYVPAGVRAAIAVAGAAFLAFVVKVVARDVQRDPVLRFFTLGALLAVVPMLATVPSDRLLLPVGFGAFGLVATVIGDLAAPRAPALPRDRRWLRGAWIAIHLFLAPVVLLLGCVTPLVMGTLGERAVAGVALGPESARQTLVVINAPNVFALQPLLFPPDDVSSRPGHLRMLAVTGRPVRVHREDARTLRLEVLDGPKSDPYTALFRDPARPLRAGDVEDTPGMVVDVERVDADGEPTVFRARFERDLDGPDVRVLAWMGGKLADFALPAVGREAVVGP